MSNQSITKRWNVATSFIALFVFVVLSGLRDVAVKALFEEHQHLSITMVATVSIVVTWGVFYCIVSLMLKRPYMFHDLKYIPIVDKLRILYLNIGTIGVTVGTFFAVKQLNAYIGALIDSSFVPVTTAILALKMRREKMSWAFWICMFVSVVAVSSSVLQFSMLNMRNALQGNSIIGLLGGITACLAFSLNQVWNKELVDHGIVGERLIVFRFSGAAIVMLVVGSFELSGVSATLLMVLTGIAVIGVAIPMYLLVRLLERLEVKHIAMAMYLVPIVALFGSLSAGQVVHAGIMLDILVAMVVIISVAIGERFA